MHEFAVSLIPALFFGMLGLAILYAAYLWGGHVARVARHACSPTWKLYLLAFLPSLVILVALRMGRLPAELTTDLMCLTAAACFVSTFYQYYRPSVREQ